MADGSVTIAITGDVGDIEKKLDEVNNKLNQVGTSGSAEAQEGFNKTSDSASNLADKGMKAIIKAAAAVGTALSSAATAAAMAGMNYESAFAQVETIMDQTVMTAADMSDAIQTLSNETGQSASDLSESVYNAISATGDTAGAVELAADASKLATAGFAETSDALSVLTTITNAYGMSTDEASAISDSLIETQNLGVTTVAQLASSMGKAIATASAYSIDLSNLEASYVSLTKAGISTEESTTYLSSMFNELGDSGSDVAGIIQDKTGMSFGQLMDAGYSLGDVLGILVDSVDGDTEALMNLWGSAEAGKAASAIAGQGIDTFNDNLETLSNSAGTTEDAYETMTQTLSYQLNLLKTRVTNFGTTVYEKFSEPATEAVGALADAFDELIYSVTEGELSDEMDSIATSIGELVGKASDLVSDVLPGIISGFSWLLDNLNLVADLLVGGAAAFGAYKVAVAAAKVETIAATAAEEGLAAALGANPIGLAVVGIVAGVTAMSALVDVLQNSFSTEDTVASKCAEITTEMGEMADEIQSAVDAYQEFKGETDDNAASTSELITQLDGMVAAYDGTQTSADAITETIEQLNDAIPGLNLSWDEQSNTLSETAEKMELLNEQYAAQAEYEESQSTEETLRQDRLEAIDAQQEALEKLTAAQRVYDDEVAAGNDENLIAGYAADVEAAQEAYDAASETAKKATTAYNNQQMATNEAANAYNEAAEAVEEYDAAQEETVDNTNLLSDEQKELISSLNDIRDGCSNASGTASELREQYETLKKSYDELDTEGQEYRRELTEQALEQLNVKATTAELAEGLGYLASNAQIDYSTISEQLIATGQSASDFASTVTGALSDIVNGYEEYDTTTYTSLADAQAALESNTATQQSWVTDLTTLWNQAVDSGSSSQMAYVQSLYNMGIESDGIVKDLVSNTGASLDEMAGEYAESTAAAGEQAALGLAMSSGEIYEAGQALAEDGASGLEDSSDVTGSAAQTAGQQAVDDFTSVDFQGAGTTAMDAVYTGITSRISRVVAGARLVGNSAKNAIANIDWTMVGYNIDQGVANGILNNTSVVTSAAQQMAEDAYTAAKNKLEINSPSHLFRDQIGSSIAEGTAAGIEKYSYLATDSVQLMADDVVQTAQEATIPRVESIQTSVSNSSTTVNTAGLVSILTSYLPQILENMGRDVVLDSGALVGATVDKYDAALGRTATRRARG